MKNFNRLAVVAHPDDAEGLFGHNLQQKQHDASNLISNLTVIVATNGDGSTIDRVGDCFCRPRS
jgi:LmbE family N-acetylglucosaminyl deacetylase